MILGNYPETIFGFAKCRMDIPTFCEWAGIATNKLPTNIEGGSIVSLLANDGKGTVKRAREELMFHFPHYQNGVDGPHTALLLSDLKLMKFYEDNRLALYDLSKGISEQKDLSSKMPVETQELHECLKKYLADVDAQFATMNPDYDPIAPQTSRKGVKRPKKK